MILDSLLKKLIAGIPLVNPGVFILQYFARFLQMRAMLQDGDFL